MGKICVATDDCQKPAFRRGWCSMHYERWKKYGNFETIRKPGFERRLGECSVEGCRTPATARDLCGKHYQRWAKFGDPLVTKLDRERSVEDRFWSKVDKNGSIPEYAPNLGPCWLWTGALMEGYGAFWLEGRNIGAHRVSYAWLTGEVPADLELDHLCRVRACCNPAHLEPVTHWTNVARGISPHGANARKTHCPQDHEYTEENTYVYDGERHCRTCARQRNRDWYIRSKGS